MSATGVRHSSFWLDSALGRPDHPRLGGDVSADVAVIGGGIVGITTALLLKETGLRVVLLESNRLASGVSGHTTAKVTSQHGLIYGRLTRTHGPDTARAYGAVNEKALLWVAEQVESRGIECDFRRQSAFAYVTSESGRTQVEEEATAAAEAGLPAALAETTPLPYPVEAAVRFDDQAEFHPGKYLLALADLVAGDGCEIYEHSRAVEVDEDESCVVKTPGGRVSADRVVVATHYPFLDRSLAFARVQSQRSYALLCRIDGDPPEGMHISADSPSRSVRAVPFEGDELLLVGGEGHKTGEGGDQEQRYRALEAFARENWNVLSVEHRWSTQDNTTVDGLPYVGRLTLLGDRVLMATGFAKWGMTGGTAAALVLADLIRDVDNPWARLFDPCRLTVRASARKLVTENAQVGLHFLGDRLRAPGRRPIDDLSPGEAGIVRHEGEKVAAFRDEDGRLTAVSPTCTHLGCQVTWNSAESSWDCPCHGSRFSPEGDVLHGPAVHRLERKPLR